MADPREIDEASRRAQEEVKRIRAELGQRCAFLADRVQNGPGVNDPVAAGASNVIRALSWGLKRDDPLGGVVLRLLDENAKLILAMMMCLEKHIEGMVATGKSAGIVTPSTSAVLGIEQSRNRQ